MPVTLRLDIMLPLNNACEKWPGTASVTSFATRYNNPPWAGGDSKQHAETIRIFSPPLHQWWRSLTSASCNCYKDFAVRVPSAESVASALHVLVGAQVRNRLAPW